MSTEIPRRRSAPRSSPPASAEGGARGSGRRRAPARARAQLPALTAPGGAAATALEGQDRLAAYAAHELRAPLALQRTLVEVALADPYADTAALRAMGERVLASCEQQRRLLEALIDLTRSRCGLRRREPVDLAAAASEALREQDRSGLESVVTLAPAATTGDPDLVARLAANLVSNATRHNVAGGRIEVATRAEGDRAVLLVANSGRFIPAAELARLFEPFRRLGPQPGGVGLGLAIVQAIADAHDAVIDAEAGAGGGLTIEVGFPRAGHPLTAVAAAIHGASAG